jgi:integrase/recombinase XerD
MKEQFINSVMAKVCDVISLEEARRIKSILENELYNYDLVTATKELVPIQGIPEKLLIYLAAKKLDGLSDLTLKNYKQHLLRFARFTQKEVHNITTMDIRMYLANYGSGGQKKSTISTEISYLKSFFSWLKNEGYINEDPMCRIKNIKTEKKVRSALSPEELELIRDNCKNLREKAFVELFYSTGCRLEEIRKLDKDDIQWHNDTAVVMGKGSKERPVFLNAKAKIHLWKYLQSRTDDNPALFVSTKKPFGRLCRRSIEKTFNDLGKKAGINKSVFPHLVRHTTATHMLSNGTNLAEVQHYLGHEDPATTQIYVDFDTTQLQQSHKKHLA